jgi:flagellar hook-length control protein FliK
MTDLPINISNASPSAVASKPLSKAEDAPQGAQDFDDVLAQQLADLSTPADSSSSSSGEPYAQANETNKADKSATTQVENADKSLPADMLAVLLAYPQPVTPSQTEAQGLPESTMQAAINNATAPADPALLPIKDKGKFPGSVLPSAGTSTAKPVSVKQAGTNTTSKPGNGIGNLPNASTSAADATLTATISPAPLRKGMAEVLKAADMKEAGTAAGKLALAAGASSELAISAQQPGNMPQSINPSSSAPLAISTPLSQPAWADEFGQKITWMASQGNQSAELHLNPPQLGPLDVTIKINGDQATALFTSPHAAVRDAIEQAMPKLREILADSGIMLGNAMVSDQSARQQPEQTSHKPRNRASSADGVTATESASAAETRVTHIKQHQGMVDTFA